ncbi:MAG: translation initiation factor IF-5A [Nitrososphaerota archaeon]|nr:translation initiation factor IF-5A [Nitrososphaerales archaeon]MDW8045164.1 translation initiation factor IF-5A [Nitrososphaerota archaeon]
MSKPVELGSLRVGSYIVLDGEPCRIVEFEKSKPGKHGSAKVRVVGIGLFSDSKKSYVSPAESQVEVPIIEKRSGQVIALMQNSVQLMDLETFEVFETDMPKEEELKKNLTQGVEVEYWRVLGRTKIMRIKG